MDKKFFFVYTSIFLLFFLVVSMFFFTPVFTGFVVKNNFSNYSFFEYDNVSFLYNKTFFLPSNVTVKAIVFDGFLIIDKNPYFVVYSNNVSFDFFDNNSNNIVGFVSKIFNDTFKNNTSFNFSDNKSLSNNMTFNNSNNSNFSFNNTNITNNTFNTSFNLSNSLKNDTFNFTLNHTDNISSNSSNFTFNNTNNTQHNITYNISLNNNNSNSNISNNTNITNITINISNNNVTNNTINTINTINITDNNSVNNSNFSSNVTILNYGEGFFDFNNDGVVSKNGAVDFKILNNFSSSSCTFWSVVSDKNSFFVCSGNDSCCSSFGLDSSYNDPSYFVLYYDNIKSNSGVVLAKTDNFSFSNPLTFNFTGKEEKQISIKGCDNNLCNLNLTTNNFTINTNGLFYGSIKIYYNSNNSCTPKNNSDWIVFLEDNCQVSSNINIYPYKVKIYGSSGSFTIKNGGSLTVKGVDFSPDDFNGDAYFNIEKGGKLVVKP